MEDGSVAVNLPNLGAQHIVILIVLCFHCQGIFGRRFMATPGGLKFRVKGKYINRIYVEDEQFVDGRTLCIKL